jgi:hypothetical protein
MRYLLDLIDKHLHHLRLVAVEKYRPQMYQYLTRMPVAPTASKLTDGEAVPIPTLPLTSIITEFAGAWAKLTGVTKPVALCIVCTKHIKIPATNLKSPVFCVCCRIGIPHPKLSSTRRIKCCAVSMGIVSHYI